jgi:hypothetical protein
VIRTGRLLRGLTPVSGGARSAACLVVAAFARHWPFILVATVGIALRVVALIAYSPSVPLRNNDAYQYLARAVTLSPEGSFHPFLYSATLKPFLLADAFSWLTVVQHAAGVAAAFLLYVLVCRFGVAPWVATLGAAPVLLDGYQIALEHQVFAETFFELFAVAGVAALAWNAALRWPAAALGGLLIATSVLFRFAGLAVIAAAVLYALMRRTAWIPFLVLVVSLAIPLGAYATWFHNQTGTFGLTNRNGFYLYGRVAAFADCRRVEVPTEERVFCPENIDPRSGRGLFASGLPDDIRRDPRYNGLASSFARRMIREYPAAYSSAVLSDFARYFRSRASQDSAKWLLPLALRAQDDRRVPPGVSIHFRLDRSLASLLRSWQQAVSVYGPLLGVLLILGVVGGAVGWTTRQRPPLGPEAAFFTLAALGLMVFPTIFAVYHFRYTIPAVPFAGVAAVTGAWVLWDRLQRRRSRPTIPA